MNTLIRRLFIGFRQDRDQVSLTISIYMNMVSMFVRRVLVNVIMTGIVLSVFYWLLFISISLSPNALIGSPIWLAYSDEYRSFAASSALCILIAGAMLYIYRIYDMGRFIEQRYIEEGLLFSEDQFSDFAELMSQDGSNTTQKPQEDEK